MGVLFFFSECAVVPLEVVLFSYDPECYFLSVVETIPSILLRSRLMEQQSEQKCLNCGQVASTDSPLLTCGRCKSVKFCNVNWLVLFSCVFVAITYSPASSAVNVQHGHGTKLNAIELLRQLRALLLPRSLQHHQRLPRQQRLLRLHLQLLGSLRTIVLDLSTNPS